jgi:flagellar biosynthesis GTPase FlhF
MPEEPSIPVIVERLANVQDDVTEIKRNMATRTDQAHVDDRIKDLVAALASERAERVAAVEKETLARNAAVEKEAGERKKVAERLQVVEDRMEARKYNVGIAIALSVLGSGLGVIALAFRPLFGG